MSISWSRGRNVQTGLVKDSKGSRRCTRTVGGITRPWNRPKQLSIMSSCCLSLLNMPIRATFLEKTMWMSVTSTLSILRVRIKTNRSLWVLIRIKIQWETTTHSRFATTQASWARARCKRRSATLVLRLVIWDLAGFSSTPPWIRWIASPTRSVYNRLLV